jgi:hypothetical protein
MTMIIKVKVKLSLCLTIKHHANTTYRGVEVLLHHSSPRHYIEMSGQLHALAALPPERTPGTHWIGD